MLLLRCLPLCITSVQATSATIKNPDGIIVASIAEPETVDPAWCYDKASEELVFNVYQRLIFYDRERVDKFVPMLALEWYLDEVDYVWYFKIRCNETGYPVMFHNSDWLTTEDVEYTFERAMVVDRYGAGWPYSPVWMFYEPLLGCYEANLSDPDFDAKIDNAVQHNATHIWFNLAGPFTPLIFKQTIAQPWASIVNKDWCMSLGDWPQTWDNWTDYHDPKVSPLDSPEHVMCGTGPYRFDYWEKGVEWCIVKFDDYWRGWPSEITPSYVSRVTVKIPEWSTRKSMFLAGDLDICYVPRRYMDQVEGQPGIRCIYPLPMLIFRGMFFNINVSINSRYLKPPFSGHQCDYGELNETGFPPDFFSDIDVRKGFAYAFNYSEFLEEAYFNEAFYPGSPVIYGLPYRNPDQEKYQFNLTKAEEHFRKAWGGKLWGTGFTIYVVEEPGGFIRKVMGQILKANVESINSKFHVNVTELVCTTYYRVLASGELPLFYVGWGAEYPDPHNFVHPCMHSQGAFAIWQRYSNATVDALIYEEKATTDETRRKQIFYELQQIYFDECPSVALAQPLVRRFERHWVQGWYYNPAYPGYPGNYFYHLWKATKPVTATVDIDPHTLSLTSRGKWITAYIELPEGYNVSNIYVNSILLNDTILVDVEAPIAVGDYDLDDIPDLMVKFDRATMIEWLGTIDFGEDTGKYYEISLTITGTVAVTQFSGSDRIKVLRI